MESAECRDIIGSRFEFDRGGKTKEFKLFTKADNWTDDTVMTLAVGEGLMRAGKNASVEEIHKEVTSSIRNWGHRYPNAGYGIRFASWLHASNPKPYYSFGNGSAMRVSAAGWLYDSVDRTREVAKATAEVTHNHPEGIKGAECTAAVMFLSRTGVDKQEIKKYVVDEFGYNMSESLDELRARHRHDESCQDSLPKALTAFFEGESYEDVIRNAVSLGGDTDTIAAIAGAMAEAYFGIPIVIMAEGNAYLEEDMLEVLELFDSILGRRNTEESAADYKTNEYIKMAVQQIYEDDKVENYFVLLDVLAKRMAEEGEVPTPMVDENNVFESLDIAKIQRGDALTLEHDMRLTFDTMIDTTGTQWIPLFTDEEELNAGNTANIQISVPISIIVESGLNSDRASGIVINPFGKAVSLNKEILAILMNRYKELYGND